MVLENEQLTKSFCTRSRDRTGTGFTPLVFETSASTNSAIRASQTGLQRYAKNDKNYQLKLMVFFKSGCRLLATGQVFAADSIILFC